MESRKHCAYNQTRECFLGLDVHTAGVHPNLTDQLETLAFKSGGGLWMRPAGEISATAIGGPLDLVYLDKDCRVIETAESLIELHADPPSQRAASVLALPVHTIYLSQTQPGDQLVICTVEEMGHHLEGNFHFSGLAESQQSAVHLAEAPLGNARSIPLDTERQSAGAILKLQHSVPNEQAKSGERIFKPRGSWIARWLRPDSRKAQRVPAPGLVAHFWTGAASAGHGVRDISATGLYLQTQERWYPGTMILMTLQRMCPPDDRAQSSISVRSTIVRWGDDGIGLHFLLRTPKESPAMSNHLAGGAYKKDFDKFLKRLRECKNSDHAKMFSLL
jgi:hypothetical protein